MENNYIKLDWNLVEKIYIDKAKRLKRIAYKRVHDIEVAEDIVQNTMTMDFKAAAQLINEIKPEIAVPTHYGDIVGTSQDATDFIKLLHQTTKGVILKNS